MVNTTALRAGAFLDAVHPGPSKNKRVAQALGISPDMAKLLRRGHGWTVARLDDMARRHGKAFVRYVYEPFVGLDDDLTDLRQRQAALEAQYATLVRRDDAMVAPIARAAIATNSGLPHPQSRDLAEDQGAVSDPLTLRGRE